MSNMSFINRNIPHLPAHPYQLRLAYISYVLKKLLHITFVCKIQVAYAHMHICTYAHMHIRTYAHMHICTYAHIHICTYAHMHICTYAHKRICTYTHMHIFGKFTPYSCSHVARIIIFVTYKPIETLNGHISLNVPWASFFLCLKKFFVFSDVTPSLNSI